MFEARHADGRRAARKVFVGSPLAALVNTILLGADNPYVWSPAALEEAALRRRILAHLVAYWMPNKLGVARPLAAGRNEALKANELLLEFIDGRAARLRHPFSGRQDAEDKELVREVMKPLCARLMEAGLDGMAWQAGFGNPVAASNFLRVVDAQGSARWVWVDLESGVPALFPLSPWALVRFYLPRALARGRPLFDDIDVDKLGAYVAMHRHAIRERLGPDGWHELQLDLTALRELRDDWRGLGRLERSLRSRLAAGAIDERQARWYRSRPVRWYARESLRMLGAGVRRLHDAARRYLAPARLRAVARAAGRFLASSAFRAEVARRVVQWQIESWHRRRQFDDAEAAHLQDRLHGDEASLYLTDFGVHVAIKPVTKAFAWLIVPALYGVGLIGEAMLIGGVLMAGSIGRTLYTGPRVVGAFTRRAPRPWLALAVGALPVVGNAAFPLQLLYDAKQRDNVIAQFLVYDIFARIGRHVPIWGGQDSLLEHWSNRVGHAFLRRIGLYAGPVTPRPGRGPVEAPGFAPVATEQAVRDPVARE